MYTSDGYVSAQLTKPERAIFAKRLAAAGPGHLEAVRRHFIDRLTPEQLDVIADAAEAVLDGFDQTGRK
ncbi:MAG: hypothetical protein ACRDRN_21120 [Sciscionella sp.]